MWEHARIAFFVKMNYEGLRGFLWLVTITQIERQLYPTMLSANSFRWGLNLMKRSRYCHLLISCPSITHSFDWEASTVTLICRHLRYRKFQFNNDFFLKKRWHSAFALVQYITLSCYNAWHLWLYNAYWTRQMSLKLNTHVRRKDFFQGGAIVDISMWWPKAFFRRGPTVMNFILPTRK